MREGEPQENNYVLFEEIIDDLPEEERDLARSDLDFKKGFYTGFRSKAMEILNDFLSGITNERRETYGESEEKAEQYVRGCKLFHLLAGSSVRASEWADLRYDLPHGEYRSFIERERAEIAERKANE